jgi:galactokinase
LAEFERAADRLSPVVENRCRFIIEEDARVSRFADAVRAGDRRAMGELMTESFRGACDLFEIGAPSMTAMMRAMTRGPGFIGGRQSGAGFGGCLVAVVEATETQAFVSSVYQSYAAATDLEPAVYPVWAGEAAGLHDASWR